MKILSLLFLSLALVLAPSLIAQGTTPIVQFMGSNVEVDYVENEGSLIDVYGAFSIKLNVTASSGDVYLNQQSVFLSLNHSDGFNWSLRTGSSGSIRSTQSIVDNLSSSPSIPGYFLVHEGDTETFQLYAIVRPEGSGLYGVSLNELNWATSPQGQQNFLPLQGFDTSFTYIEAVPEPSTVALGALGIGALLLLRRKRP